MPIASHGIIHVIMYFVRFLNTLWVLGSWYSMTPGFLMIIQVTIGFNNKMSHCLNKSSKCCNESYMKQQIVAQYQLAHLLWQKNHWFIVDGILTHFWRLGEPPLDKRHHIMERIEEGQVMVRHRGTMESLRGQHRSCQGSNYHGRQSGDWSLGNSFHANKCKGPKANRGIQSAMRGWRSGPFQDVWKTNVLTTPHSLSLLPLPPM